MGAKGKAEHKLTITHKTAVLANCCDTWIERHSFDYICVNTWSKWIFPLSLDLCSLVKAVFLDLSWLDRHHAILVPGYGNGCGLSSICLCRCAQTPASSHHPTSTAAGSSRLPQGKHKLIWSFWSYMQWLVSINQNENCTVIILQGNIILFPKGNSYCHLKRNALV